MRIGLKFAYKGYRAAPEWDAEIRAWRGRILGIRDVVTFQGETPWGVADAFHDSVDDYLEFCAQQGREPERPITTEDQP